MRLLKKILYGVAVATLLASKSSFISADVTNIWPLPNTATYNQGSPDALLLNPDNFQLIADGDNAKSSSILSSAISRFPKYIFPDYPSFDTPATKVLAKLSSLSISLSSNSEVLNQDTDEFYNLTISNDGTIASLQANTVFGALRGLETFTQLIDFSQLDPATSKPIYKIERVPIQVIDAPRYKYRGLMIDTARHYLPLKEILDNLDVMAFNKLNVLHWHIVDGQSFPYQSAVYPELSAKGAWQADHIYTIDQVKNVVAEAKLRGIRVIPEFDTPGHTGSWGKSMPEIMSHCPDPNDPLDPTNNKTYEVLENLYKEIIQVWTDEYVHLGGDEVSFDCWRADPSISAWMQQNNVGSYEQLEQHFETTLLDIVGNTLNKKTVVWQEIFNNGLKVRPDTVIDMWKDYDVGTIDAATKQGLQVIISGCYYLDHLNQDWNDFYNCNPVQWPGSDAQKQLVIGGHCSMWAEHVDAATFMSRVWPRASAVAEKLWTAQQFSPDQVEGRLNQFRCRMVARGISANPLGPGYCPVELKYSGLTLEDVEEQGLVLII